MGVFVGRERELAILKQLLRKRSASMVVVRGRRRIGKTRLISEFASQNNSVFFSGLPPEKMGTAQEQRDTFAHQMAENFNMPFVAANRWSTLFWHLAQQAKDGRIVIVFDEISWIGSKDRSFLGELKNAWDLHFSRNHQLILILCGSVSSWIERNILSSTGFVGRVSVDLWVRELPLKDCSRFWVNKRVSAHEKFQLLSVTGGIPKYLEEVVPEMSSLGNIQRLCFQEDGLLFREFESIFSDLFTTNYTTYRDIVTTLADGPLTLTEMCAKRQVARSGSVSQCLKNLILAGFVSEAPVWSLKEAKISRHKKFRVSDNYIRFFLKVIAPASDQILGGNFKGSQELLRAHLGLQFENLVLSNLHDLYPLLDIAKSDVLQAGPYFQQGTKRKKGCQIDLMIQTRARTLYVCEIKYYAGVVESSVATAVEGKIERLSLPRGFSVRPVLIHSSEISLPLEQSDRFDYVVDFADLLGDS